MTRGWRLVFALRGLPILPGGPVTIRFSFGPNAPMSGTEVRNTEVSAPLGG
jgi:hypothetical protein